MFYIQKQFLTASRDQLLLLSDSIHYGATMAAESTQTETTHGRPKQKLCTQIASEGAEEQACWILPMYPLKRSGNEDLNQIAHGSRHSYRDRTAGGRHRELRK